MHPLLSICIPTFNRVDNLKCCIDSLVHQKEFNDEVEIVISDNASTDDTQAVCLEYSNKYNNIKYHRNSENVTMLNFPIVFGLATGELAKLTNDTTVFCDGSLRKILKLIKDNIKKRPAIFFQYLNKKNVECNGIEEFLYTISYNTTWIAGLSLWKEDRNNIRNNITDCDTYLWQVPILLDSILKHKESIIFTEKLFSFKNIDIEKRAKAYGADLLYNIFYTNYLNIIKRYLEKGIISGDCFSWLKQDLLYNFFIDWIITLDLSSEIECKEEAKRLLELLKSVYSHEVYYKNFQKTYSRKKNKNKIKYRLKKIRVIKTFLQIKNNLR